MDAGRERGIEDGGHPGPSSRPRRRPSHRRRRGRRMADPRIGAFSPDDFLDSPRVDAREEAWHEMLARDAWTAALRHGSRSAEDGSSAS